MELNDILIFVAGFVGTFGGLTALRALWRKRVVSGTIGKAVRDNRVFQYKEYREEEATDLPECVQRYLRYALPRGQPVIKNVWLHQKGRLKPRDNTDWQSFKANAFLAAGHLAFVWNARIELPKKLWKSAQLVYRRGRGNGLLRLTGGFTLYDMEGPEADVSILVRLLCESVWCPTLFVPGCADIQWEEIDENSATATLSDAGITVSATFFMDEEGKITHVVTDDKYRDYKGAYIRQRFTMYVQNYTHVNDIAVPSEASFEWDLEGSRFNYLQLKVEELRFDFAAPTPQ